MPFSITRSKLTGNPNEKGWAQIHEFKPEDEEKLKKRGRLYAVIATSNSKAEIENVVTGRELLARFHEEYFGNLDLSAFNALKDACEKVINEFSQRENGVQIAAISVVDSVVYSASGGGAQVAIFRDGMLATILESKVSKSGETVEVVSASGYPKTDDLLILGTNSFFESFPAGRLKPILGSKDPETITETLAPTTHSLNKSGSLGAAFLKFSEEGAFFNKSDGEKKDESSKEKKKISFEPLLNIKEKLVNGFQNTERKILAKTSRLPERKIFVKEGTVDVEVAQNRKTTVTVGGILLTLLLVSIIFGIQQKRKNSEKERYQPRLDQAKHEYEEAVGLFSLDANRARELFIESERKVTLLLEEGIDDQELIDLSERINESQGKILGLYKDEPELFIDLSLLSDGFTGSNIVASEDNAFIFDKDGRKIIRISLDNKKSEVVAGPEQINGEGIITAYTDRTFFLIGSEIKEVGENNKTAVEGSWQGEVLLSAYAGNLYVLEKNKSAVWRYSAIEGGFSSGANWLSEGVSPDLTRIISWNIDGSIWLLNNSGKIFKFSLGNQQDFSISGLAPSLVFPKAIYTNENIESIYILDPEQKRIVVIDKDGQYQAQYENDKISEASGIVVNEKIGKIILLSSQRLYSIPLNHL